jgi:hypothetical protein
MGTGFRGSLIACAAAPDRLESEQIGLIGEPPMRTTMVVAAVATLSVPPLSLRKSPNIAGLPNGRKMRSSSSS